MPLVGILEGYVKKPLINMTVYSGAKIRSRKKNKNQNKTTKGKILGEIDGAEARPMVDRTFSGL
jgi:hypothetical protein